MESKPKGSAAGVVAGAVGAGADVDFGFLFADDLGGAAFVAELLFCEAESRSHQLLSIYFILIQDRKCCKSLLLRGALILAVLAS